MRIEPTTFPGIHQERSATELQRNPDPGCLEIRWAVDENWTHDLFLTKEVLYPWATTALKIFLKNFHPM